MAADLFTQYENVRGRLSALAPGLPDDELATTVPACPAWTVRQLLAHLSGVCHDLPNGVFPTGGDAWTAAQVESREEMTAAEVLADWATHSQVLSAKIGEMGTLGGIMVADAAIHEQDILNALGRAGQWSTPEFDGLLPFFATFLSGRLAKDALAPLRMVADGDVHIAGEGEPAATVTASKYDLTRALIGRRTLDEIRAFDWAGDVEAYLPHLSGFPPPAASLGE